MLRIPTENLQTPDTGQDTYREPANLWHWSGYLQSTCKPLTLVRIPSENLQIPDTGHQCDSSLRSCCSGQTPITLCSPVRKRRGRSSDREWASSHGAVFFLLGTWPFYLTDLLSRRLIGAVGTRINFVRRPYPQGLHDATKFLPGHMVEADYGYTQG